MTQEEAVKELRKRGLTDIQIIDKLIDLKQNKKQQNPNLEYKEERLSDIVSRKIGEVYPLLGEIVKKGFDTVGKSFPIPETTRTSLETVLPLAGAFALRGAGLPANIIGAGLSYGGTLELEKHLGFTKPSSDLESATRDALKNIAIGSMYEAAPPGVGKVIQKTGVGKAIQKVSSPIVSKVVGAVNKPLEDIVQTLRGTKGMTADQIMSTHPNIKLTRDVGAKDVYGNKVEIPKGEIFTPYEMKDGKIVLQDGQTYVVSKNQYANIKGNAITGEAKPFAPELAGTEEVVKKTDKMAIRNKAYADFDAGRITREQRNAIIDKLGVPNETKFSSLQLPGGESYKEILIKAPSVINEIVKAEVAGNKELAKQLRQSQFRSSHWDELNIISWLRLNERTYQGKKVTFMEELQSDWAREGRKKGFAQEITKDNIIVTKKGVENPYWEATDKNGNFLVRNAGNMSKEDFTRYVVENANIGKLPYHPILKNWQESSIKRALKEAVDNNSEYFAWINGEQTSARYNLATYLDNVNWKSAEVGGYAGGDRVAYLKTNEGSTINLVFNKNGKILKGKEGWAGKKLDEVLGKGLAGKLMEKESGTLSGEGLKFGGEWANNLYDKQIKNIVEDLTGAKVQILDLGLPVSKVKGKKTVQQGIKITPEIRAKIKGEALKLEASGKMFETPTTHDKESPVAKAIERVKK